MAHILWASLWVGLAGDALNRARTAVKAEARKSPGVIPISATRLAEADIGNRHHGDDGRAGGVESAQGGDRVRTASEFRSPRDIHALAKTLFSVAPGEAGRLGQLP